MGWSGSSSSGSGRRRDGWGSRCSSIGLVSALGGVLWALVQHDLKRLLAYHSIENVGIIALGLGASLLFADAGRT